MSQKLLFFLGPGGGGGCAEINVMQITQEMH